MLPLFTVKDVEDVECDNSMHTLLIKYYPRRLFFLIPAICFQPRDEDKTEGEYGQDHDTI